jgi:hypothetical protein
MNKIPSQLRRGNRAGQMCSWLWRLRVARIWFWWQCPGIADPWRHHYWLRALYRQGRNTLHMYKLLGWRLATHRLASDATEVAWSIVSSLKTCSVPACHSEIRKARHQGTDRSDEIASSYVHVELFCFMDERSRLDQSSMILASAVAVEGSFQERTRCGGLQVSMVEWFA